jgi:hypothetical protein
MMMRTKIGAIAYLSTGMGQAGADLTQAAHRLDGPFVTTDTKVCGAARPVEGGTAIRKPDRHLGGNALDRVNLAAEINCGIRVVSKAS